MELLLRHVGQSSWIVTVTVFWFLVFVILTCLPQSDEATSDEPYLLWSAAKSA